MKRGYILQDLLTGHYVSSYNNVAATGELNCLSWTPDIKQAILVPKRIINTMFIRGEFLIEIRRVIKSNYD